MNESINESINQSISMAKLVSVSRQRNRCSTSKLMKQFRIINGTSGVVVSMGGRPSQRDMFWDVSWRFSTEVAERTNSRKLFQRERAQKWTVLAPVLVLNLGTDRLIPLFDLGDWDGSDGAKHGVNTESKWKWLCRNISRRFWIHWTLVRSLLQYRMKVNCNNQDDWTQEHLQATLHYPDQGNGKHATKPAHGKRRSCRLMIFVSEWWNFFQILLQNSEQILLGYDWHQKAHRKQREVSTRLSFIPDEEESSFIWVQYQLIRRHPRLDRGQAQLQAIQCRSRVTWCKGKISGDYH